MTFAREVEFYFSSFQTKMRSTYTNQNTIRIHENCIVKFVIYCYENFDNNALTFKTLSIEHINNYFEWIEKKYNEKQDKEHPGKIKKMSCRTKQSHLLALKIFFKYITQNNKKSIKIDTLLDDYKIKLKRNRKLKFFMETNERNAILDHVENKLTKKHEYKYNKNFRNSLFTKLVFQIGIRIETALKLKISDFQESNNEYYIVRITENEEQDEKILVPKTLIRSDLEYIVNFNNGDAYVFNAGKDPQRPLALQSAYNIFKKIRLSL